MARAKPRTHTFSWLGLSQVPHSGTSEMARAKPRTQLAPHTSDLFLPPAGGVCVCKPLDTRGFVFSTFRVQTGGQRGWGGGLWPTKTPPPSCENVPVFFQNGKRLSQGPQNSARRFN